MNELTLRDIFAAVALLAISVERSLLREPLSTWGEHAAEAYTAADAMLAARYPKDEPTTDGPSKS